MKEKVYEEEEEEEEEVGDSPLDAVAVGRTRGRRTSKESPKQAKSEGGARPEVRRREECAVGAAAGDLTEDCTTWEAAPRYRRCTGGSVGGAARGERAAGCVQDWPPRSE
ncbi:hypothetical protein E2C01_014723 [Portunus trituberculatus]|uniref:Uncharacterized protein n=1 Tax=Portunus trituberculatus TaxID=210409 RepID=A0A5B7DKZ1_PORTR|nr:hypothetical protein [Portunus trituberculatus]